MAERYDPAENDGCSYAWLSEWLCEYVDGTMDPSVRAVFEEYLEANPALRDHVNKLCRTRDLLERCACREQKENVARDLQARLGRHSECDLMQARVPFVGKATDHVGTFVAVASAMSIMLGVGVFIGAFFFAEPAVRASSEGRASVEAVRESGVQPPPARATPLDQSGARAPVARPAWQPARSTFGSGRNEPVPLFLADTLRGGQTFVGLQFVP